VVARNVLFLRAARHKIRQQTLVARMRPFRIIEIDAGKRVLEKRGRFPWSTYRTSVTTLFEEVEFELQHFEDVSLIIGHGYLLQETPSDAVIRGRSGHFPRSAAFSKKATRHAVM
jgi:hypothetical protein